MHRSRSTSLDGVGQGAFPSYLFFAWLHPSWQVSTDCLFESNAGRIRVEQDIRVPSFDIDVTALFRDDIQHRRAALNVKLPARNPNFTAHAPAKLAYCIPTYT